MSTFKLDCYAGWDEASLKNRCRELARAYSQQQMIILILADGGFDALPQEWKDKVTMLREAHAD